MQQNFYFVVLVFCNTEFALQLVDQILPALLVVLRSPFSSVTRCCPRAGRSDLKTVLQLL